MISKSLTAAALALVAVTAATPSFAQGIEIGRDGVRLVDPNAQRPGDRRDDRRDDRRAARDISERDAVRIARGEGVREVDDVRRTNRSFRVVGVDRSGEDIQVDIDRRSGDVLSVR